jgi:hypothetical protein
MPRPKGEKRPADHIGRAQQNRLWHDEDPDHRYRDRGSRQIAAAIR